MPPQTAPTIDNPSSMPVASYAAPTGSSAPRLSPRWLLVVAALLLLWNLGYTGLINPDEGRYAAAAAEMAGFIHGVPADWIVPHLDTIPRLNKPPLVYWLAAIFYRLCGPSEFAARLVPALAALIVMGLVWLTMRRVFGEGAAALSAFVWATCTLPFCMARFLNTDMLLTCSMALTLCGLFAALEHANPQATGDAAPAATTTRLASWPGWLMVGVGGGLALLAKGPVGVALPCGIAIVYLGVIRGWRQIAWLPLLASLILMLLIGVPWYLAVERRQPGFLNNFLLHENFARFSGAQAYHNAAGPWFYLPVLLLGLIPWSGFLLPAFARRSPTAVTSPGRALSELQRRLRLFLWLWAGLLIAFFSVSHTKLVSYVLPAFPALAMLIGIELDRFATASVAMRRLVVGLTLLLNFALIAAGAHFLLNGKLLSRSEGRSCLLILGAVIVAGSVVLLWAMHDRHSHWRVALSQAAFAAALLVTVVVLAGRIMPFEDASPMLRALRPFLQPDDRLVLYRTFIPAAEFYSARPVEIVDFANKSGLDDEALRHSPLFLPKSVTTTELLRRPQRVFILLPRKANIPLPPAAYLIARNTQCDLVSNRPRPQGFEVDFTSQGHAVMNR
jgi:4-amino-4-deoxy-L-arabinose transferase-like glycosyltransferase